MHKNIILALLSKQTKQINIFDEFVLEVEAYFHRQVYTIQDMKDRDNKKLKGDVWELFCKDWLLASGKYKNIWLLSEYNALDFTERTVSSLQKQDAGIDLIGETIEGKYIAIQCKYRSKNGRVNWTSLSTFIGLCERTGPWVSYLVMTNCRSITRKVPRSKKDKSICLKTLQSTSRDQFLRICGTYVENKVSEEKIVKPKTIEELRQARLDAFSLIH